METKKNYTMKQIDDKVKMAMVRMQKLEKRYNRLKLEVKFKQDKMEAIREQLDYIHKLIASYNAFKEEQ